MNFGSDLFLPEWYNNSYKYKNKSSKFALSKNGQILAIGFTDGSVTIQEAFTGLSEINIHPFSTAISVLDFSVTGRYCLSGDNKGVSVYDISKGEVIYTLNFENDIVVLNSFSSKIDDNYIFLLTNESYGCFYLVNITTKECSRFGNEPYTFFRLFYDDTIIAGQKTCFSIIDIHSKPVKINTKKNEFPKRDITSAEVAFKSKRVLINNNNANIWFYDLEKDIFREIYVAKADYKRSVLTHFNYTDEYFFVYPLYHTSNFIIYSVGDSSFKIEFQDGPRDSICEFLMHPRLPVLFIRTMKYINIWKVTNKDHWIKSLPDDGNMFENELFEEQETEFDLGFESARPNDVSYITTEPIDVFTRKTNARKTEDGTLWFIPFTKDDITLLADEPIVDRSSSSE